MKYIINALSMNENQEKFSVQKLADTLDKTHESVTRFIKDSDKNLLALFKENPELIDSEIRKLLRRYK